MSEGYREQGEPLALPSNDAERIAALRAREDDDLPLLEAVAQWRRGIPEAQIAQARREWEALLGEIRDAPDAPRAACDELFIRTIQLNNDLPAEEGEAVLRRAIAAQRVRSYQDVHRCMLASNALRRGELAEARQRLMDCSVDDADILADSAYRISRSLLALCEDDAAVALHCLGETYAAIPFAPSYRRLAVVYRAQALRLAGRTGEAHQALAALVAAAGAGAVARLLDRLPAGWDIDRDCLYEPLRAEVRIDGSFAAAGAALCLAGAIAAVVAWWLDEASLGQSAATSLLLCGASAWLLTRTRRWLRLARDGRGSRGIVTGRSPSRFRRADRPAREYLHVEATIDGEPIFAKSFQTFSPKSSTALEGKPVYLLWHPAEPTRARVFVL